MAGNFSRSEIFRHKIEKAMVPFFAPYNRSKLNNTDFSIISNNCWGGVCSEYFGLQKNSPTVGTFLFASDFVKLIQNLKKYMETELIFIDYEESMHRKDLVKSIYAGVPIGRLGDIEIIFLHYPTIEIAKEKWNRRVSRINWNNLIIKFSYMSNCSDEDIFCFQRIHGIKKICFVPKMFDNMEDLIVVPSRINSVFDLGDDVFYWNKYIDIVDFINQPITGIRDFVFEKSS